MRTRSLHDALPILLAPAVWLAAPASANLDAAAGLTVTVRVVAWEIVPSVTAIAAVSTLYSFIVPPAELTPLAKVIVVAVPKLTALGVLLVTVGWVTGLAA